MLRENTLQPGFGNRAIGVVAHDYKMRNSGSRPGAPHVVKYSREG